MKKLLACLMALMLLPAAALAQGFAYEWTVDMPQDALVNLVQTIEEAFPELAEDLGDMSEDMLRGAAKLMDGVEVNLHAQENLTEIGLRLCDADILTASLSSENGMMYCILDALPGIALAMPASADESVINESVHALITADWAGLGAAADEAVNAWLLTLPTAIETGSFAGEAYTGGVYRMTYQIDDRDLFVLMESLLHYEGLLSLVPELENLLTLYGLDIQTVLTEARAVAYEAARSNDYTYLVHSVSDGQYLTGLSVVAYQKGSQVGTLSLGWPEEGFKAVLGYGYQGRNVYFAAETDGAAWAVQMVKDDAMNGYTAACQNMQNVLLRLSGQNKGSSGQMTVNAALTGALLRSLEIGAEIFVDSSLSDMELSAKLMVNGQEWLSQMLRVESASDAPAPDLSGLRVVEIREDGSLSENIDSEMESFVTTLGVRVFKVLPVELLTNALEMTDLFQ